MNSIFLSSGLIIFIYMIFWFALAQVKKDNSIIDIAWGPGFVLVAVLGLIFSSPQSVGATLILILTALWGIRLGLYIFLRGLGKAEDWRYKKWREEWGNTFLIRSFFQVFMLQGFLMFLISIPIIQILGSDATFTTLSWLELVGTGLWVFGFLWEAISDFQLFHFKRNPLNKGKILMDGLWAYSRHPNYFGEIVLWWGVFIFSIPYGEWWLSLLSPIIITWLLTQVSGVPMLEKKYKENPTYLAYIKRTNALIPSI